MCEAQGPDEVHVVIPSRDRWPLLRTALAGALAQRDVAVSVVVVDDGSQDATAYELGEIHDERLHVLRQERPEGVSRARNRGLAGATAPWVAFLDDDDVWAPGHLAAMLAAARRSGIPADRVGLVYCGHLAVGPERELTHVSPALPVEGLRERLEWMNVVGGPSRVLLRTAVVQALGGFDEQLSTLADWDLWVRVAAEHEAVRCSDMLVAYMTHPGNMQLDAERFLGDLAALESKHGWRPGVRRDAVLAGHIATIYRRGGRRVRAARWYLRAFLASRAPRDLGRAAGVLLGERAIALSRLRRRRSVDPSVGWWLDSVREAERGATNGLTPLPGPHRDLAAP
jgi:glycosyltransferase involved in cell wall biosynthesis